MTIIMLTIFEVMTDCERERHNTCYHFDNLLIKLDRNKQQRQYISFKILAQGIMQPLFYYFN